MKRDLMRKTSIFVAGVWIAAAIGFSMFGNSGYPQVKAPAPNHQPSFQMVGLHLVSSATSSTAVVVDWGYPHHSNDRISALRVTLKSQSERVPLSIQFWGRDTTTWFATGLRPSNNYVVSIQGLARGGELSRPYSLQFSTPARATAPHAYSRPELTSVVSPGGNVQISWSSVAPASNVEKFILDIRSKRADVYHVEDFVNTLTHSYSLHLSPGAYQSQLSVVQFDGASEVLASNEFVVR